MKEDDIRKRDTLNKYLSIVQADCLTLFGNEDFVNIDCPACGCSRYTLQFRKTGFEYVTCEVCQTLFARNRPRLEKLKYFYDRSLSTGYWVNEFFRPVAEARREKIFAPRARDLITRFGEDPQWLVGDIGAGFGLFLSELRKLWPRSRYVAIEPSSEQAGACRHLNFQTECCMLEEITGYDAQYDLLTSFELAEHLFSPTDFLCNVLSLLTPGGWFLMTTLNGLGFDIQVLWEHSKSVYPPCHINFFNPDSLSLLLRSTGFEVREVTTPGKLDWDIVEGMIENEGFDAGRLFNMLSLKGTERCKQELQQWITSNSLSSHMCVLARKPA